MKISVNGKDISKLNFIGRLGYGILALFICLFIGIVIALFAYVISTIIFFIGLVIMLIIWLEPVFRRKKC